MKTTIKLTAVVILTLALALSAIGPAAALHLNAFEPLDGPGGAGNARIAPGAGALDGADEEQGTTGPRRGLEFILPDR